MYKEGALFATGLLSSLPLITGAVAIAEHTACGHRADTHFLHGYIGVTR